MNVKDIIRSAGSAQSLISIGLGVVIGLLISLFVPGPVAAVAGQQEAIAAALVGKKDGFVLVDPNKGKMIRPCNGNDRAGTAVDPACGYSIELNDDVESLLRVLADLIEKSQPVVKDADGVQKEVGEELVIYYLNWAGSHKCELWHVVGSGGSGTSVCVKYKKH